MKKLALLTLILLPLSIIVAQNTLYEAEKPYVRFGKYKYMLLFENYYEHEIKESGFSEVLIKGNRKQYIGHFIYQLKSATEMRISEDNPPYPQLENKIIQSSRSDFDFENERIIVTTYYYDEKEPRTKEIKTLKQGKAGFFYIEKRITYFKNGEVKEENNFSKKIELVKVPH